MSFSHPAVAQTTSFFTQPFNVNTNKIAVTPQSRWGVFRESDNITIQTTDNSTIRVLTTDGSVVYQGAPTTRQFSRGHYFIECNGDRNQFCVLPNDYAGASFLGIDAANGDTAYTERMNAIQPGWVRTMDGQWDIVQPQSNIWDWSALDRNPAANAGKKIIVRAFFRPSWVNNSNFLPSFLEYVRQMALRYQTNIYAIQIWNEPYYSTVTSNGMAWGDIANPYTGNSAVDLPVFYQTLANLITSSRDTIRSVSPTIKIFGPDWSGPGYVNETEGLAADGGINALDMFAFHASTFVRPDGPITNADGFTGYIDVIKPSLGAKPWMVPELHVYGGSALGVTNVPLPGMPGVSGTDWHRGLCRIIKTVVQWRAKGAEAIMEHIMPMYAGGTNPNYEIYGWEYAPAGGLPRGPHPKTSAYLMTGYWLNGASFVDYRTPNQNIYLYAWQRPNNTSLVFAWTLEGQSVLLQTIGLPAAIDIYGRSITPTALTEEPVLFTANGTDAMGLLNAVRSRIIGTSNVAPVLDPLPTLSVVDGQPMQFSISATDVDNDPITYSASVLPPGATFDPNTQTFSWTPSPTASGPYTVSFVASDGQGGINTLTTTITVLGNLLDGLMSHWKFDELAGATAFDLVGTNNGTLVNFNFTTNSGWVTGQNGNGLRFDGINDFVSLNSNRINLTNNFSLVFWIQPQNAGGVGAFFSARSSYLQSGFRFFVQNHMLILQGQTSTGYKYCEFAPNLLQDSVWYHVAIVYDHSLLNVYLNGVLQGTVDWGGSFVMNPTCPSFFGTENSYYFKGVLDDFMLFNRPLTAAQVQSIYSPADNPPVLTPIGSQTVTVGQTLTFTVSATDLDGDTLAYFANPLFSGASFNPTTRVFTWTPTAQQVGSVDVLFVVSDGQLSDTEVVTINVTDIAPQLAPVGTKTTVASQNLAFNLSATDVNGDAITYSAAPLPTGATLDATSGAFAWTPQTNQVGTFDVTFTASDGRLSDSKSATITVTKPVGKPTLKPIKPKLVRAGRRVRVALSATNPNRLPLTYSIGPIPTDATFDSVRRKFVWVTTNATVGAYSLTASVTDGTDTDTKPVSITLY